MIFPITPPFDDIQPQEPAQQQTSPGSGQFERAQSPFEASLFVVGTGGEPSLVGTVGSSDGSFTLEAKIPTSPVIHGRTVSARDLARRMGADTSRLEANSRLGIDVLTGKRFSPEDR